MGDVEDEGAENPAGEGNEAGEGGGEENPVEGGEGEAPAEGEEAAAEAAPAEEVPAEPPPAEKTPEEIKLEQTYEFFLKMAKSLTLQLPFERDRVIASKWVKKIETSEDELQKRQTYCKFLCMAMFSHRLAGPFKRIPNNQAELDDIGNITEEDIITDMVQDKSVFRTTPYYVEMSGDLKEYAAYQEIPNFGAHFYYAFSNETILHWHNDKRAIVPSGGLNYPILNPPGKNVSDKKETFVTEYKKYATPEPKEKIKPDMLPNLVSELHKRKVINKKEIQKMGSKKFAAQPCKNDGASDEEFKYPLVNYYKKTAEEKNKEEEAAKKAKEEEAAKKAKEDEAAKDEKKEEKKDEKKEDKKNVKKDAKDKKVEPTPGRPVGCGAAPCVALQAKK